MPPSLPFPKGGNPLFGKEGLGEILQLMSILFKIGIEFL
jgi:hypothetical protein